MKNPRSRQVIAYSVPDKSDKRTFPLPASILVRVMSICGFKIHPENGIARRKPDSSILTPSRPHGDATVRIAADRIFLC